MSKPISDVGRRTFSDGSYILSKNGQAHMSCGLPAVIHSSGSKAWYREGVIQRIVYPDGSCILYDNGEISRYSFGKGQE